MLDFRRTGQEKGFETFYLVTFFVFVHADWTQSWGKRVSSFADQVIVYGSNRCIFYVSVKVWESLYDSVLFEWNYNKLSTNLV